MTSSPSGTRPTGTNSRPQNSALSIVDVISILQASASCGVAVLKFHDLEVKFRQSQPGPAMLESPRSTAPPASPVAEMTDEEIRQVGKLALEQGELEHFETLIAELQVTNPSMYEEMVRLGDLEDDGDGPDQSE